MTEMTEQERERLAELIAIKVADRYFAMIKEHVAQQIQMHTYECAARKWGWFKSFVSAVTGGILVGITMWLIHKL